MNRSKLAGLFFLAVLLAAVALSSQAQAGWGASWGIDSSGVGAAYVTGSPSARSSYGATYARPLGHRAYFVPNALQMWPNAMFNPGVVAGVGRRNLYFFHPF